MSRKQKPDPLIEARRVLGQDSTRLSDREKSLRDLEKSLSEERRKVSEEREFLEERPKQKGVTPDVWKQARKLLSAENENNEVVEEDTVYVLDDIDWEPGDDDPILKTPRSRGASRDQSVRFQKYQFRLFANSGRNSGRNTGRDPNKQMGQQRWADGSSDSSSPLIADSVSFAAVAQSMPNAFSVGVPSTSLDYVHVLRNPTPETAWVFDEPRLKDFIVSKIPQKALDEYQRDSDGIGLVRLFGSALKAYFNLYNFFLVGQSDKGFSEDGDFESVWRFWSSEAARRRARSRLIAEGIERYGLPPEGKPAPEDYDPERVKRAWAIFCRIRAQALNAPDEGTIR